jgi:hypothetical protein
VGYIDEYHSCLVIISVNNNIDQMLATKNYFLTQDVHPPRAVTGGNNIQGGMHRISGAH